MKFISSPGRPELLVLLSQFQELQLQVFIMYLWLKYAHFTEVRENYCSTYEGALLDNSPSEIWMLYKN